MISQDFESEQIIKKSQRKLLLNINKFLPKLQNFMDNVVYHEVTVAECEEVRFEIHKIAGTGATFGFADLSVKASKFEDCLDHIIDGDDNSIEIDQIYDLASSFLKHAYMLITENLISRRSSLSLNNIGDIGDIGDNGDGEEKSNISQSDGVYYPKNQSEHMPSDSQKTDSRTKPNFETNNSGLRNNDEGIDEETSSKEDLKLQLKKKYKLVLDGKDENEEEDFYDKRTKRINERRSVDNINIPSPFGKERRRIVFSPRTQNYELNERRDRENADRRDHLSQESQSYSGPEKRSFLKSDRRVHDENYGKSDVSKYGTPKVNLDKIKRFNSKIKEKNIDHKDHKSDKSEDIIKHDKMVEKIKPFDDVHNNQPKPQEATSAPEIIVQSHSEKADDLHKSKFSNSEMAQKEHKSSVNKQFEQSSSEEDVAVKYARLLKEYNDMMQNNQQQQNIEQDSEQEFENERNLQKQVEGELKLYSQSNNEPREIIEVEQQDSGLKNNVINKPHSESDPETYKTQKYQIQNDQESQHNIDDISTKIDYTSSTAQDEQSYQEPEKQANEDSIKLEYTGKDRRQSGHLVVNKYDGPERRRPRNSEEKTNFVSNNANIEAQSQSRTTNDISKDTIILAHPNEVVLNNLAESFIKLPNEIVKISDGGDLLGAANSVRPRIILMSSDLPNIDTKSFLKDLNDNPVLKNTAIMMIYGNVNEPEIDDNQFKIIAHIKEPFIASDLIERVKVVLNEEAKKILVADDDELITNLLRIRLQKMGYNVETASDGIQAVNKAETANPELITLDLMMPGLDGLSALVKIKELKKDVPVIILSAKNQHDIVMKALDKGAYDYITKPFNIEQLVAKIESYFKRSNARQASN